MRKRILMVAAMVLALVPGARLVHAEEHHGEGSEWKQKLGLSDDQVKKMKDLHASQKAEMKPLKEKRHELVEKLEGQIKSKASDADLKSTLDELATNHESSEQVEDKFHKNIESILTPPQQAKMVIMRMKHHEKEEKAEGKKKDDDDK